MIICLDDVQVYEKLTLSRADLVGALGTEANPALKLYHEQARKLLEAVEQVQLHFIHMYG